MDSRAAVWIAPLSISSMEEPQEEINGSRLISDLSREYGQDAAAKVRERCLRLATPELSIHFVPAEARILDKIVWPLRSAKQAFSLGDYIACIALCGMVCEMVTVFTYDLLGRLLVQSDLSSEELQLFRTRRYEGWGQERRIRKLLDLGMVTELFYDNVESVRRIRREYLHLLSKSFDRLEEDAYEAYVSACSIVKGLISLVPGPQGGLLVPNHLMDYLKRKRVIADHDQER